MNYDFSWENLAHVASALAVLEGGSIIAVAIVRPYGSNDYRIMAKKDNDAPVDFRDLVNKYPRIQKFMTDSGFSLLGESINEYVLTLIEGDAWNAFRNTKEKWTQSPWVKVSAATPQHSPLSPSFWQEFFEVAPEGSFSWLLDLRQKLMNSNTPQAEAQVNQHLTKLLMRRPDWEQYASQSLRCMAQDDPSWHALLDKWGISFRRRHEQSFGPLWAIVNGWENWLNGWRKETGHTLSFTPLQTDLPSTWILEDFTASGSLWHWIAAKAPLSLAQKVLIDVPDINEEDYLGRTALHWACRYANFDVIRMLVERGVSLTSEDNQGKMACEYLPEGTKELDEIFEWMEDRRLNAPVKSLEK